MKILFLLPVAFLLCFPVVQAQEVDNPGEVAKAPTPAASAGVVDSRAQVTLKSEGVPRIGMFSSHPTLKKCLYPYSDKNVPGEAKFPAILENALFYEVPSSSASRYECTAGGGVLAVARVNAMRDETSAMSALNFQRVEGAEPFQLVGKDPADVFAVFRKTLAAGESFTLPVGSLLAGFHVVRDEEGGECLYNGIRLPKEWPPTSDLNSAEPMPVPYLTHPPKLISIDVGRQLFVDDFLIESTDLTREFHHPVKYSGNPVLKPETPLELGKTKQPLAGPKSGGLWWNPEKQLFEFWYEAGWVSTIAYATSKDGLKWERPNLPLTPGTNEVLPHEVEPDSWTVVRDFRAVDPGENYKIFIRGGDARGRARYFVSRDGTTWGKHEDGGVTGDRSTMFYNPFRKKWVFSMRYNSPNGRARAYIEANDFREGMQWLPDEIKPWARADKLDPPDPKIREKPQLYNLDAVAYESIMLAFFEILHGPNNDISAAAGTPKNTGLNFAYSRDGYHFSRPDRTMAINSENRDGAWDRGYVQSLGNICVVRGDQLWFYYVGFAGDPTNVWKPGDKGSTMQSGIYANGATGVATLRRDGFVSLNATVPAKTITTRPVTFSGKHLFANLDAPSGQLEAEIVDMDGKVIQPFSFANCVPVTGDTTLAQIKWKGGDDLTALANRPVRFRFRVTKGKFYAFWVSRDATGRSDGYIAGGGPGFTSDIDTVGKASLDAEAKLGAPAAAAPAIRPSVP